MSQIFNIDAFNAIFGPPPDKTAPTICTDHRWTEVQRSQNEIEPDLVNVQKVCGVCGLRMFSTRQRSWGLKS